MNSKLT